MIKFLHPDDPPGGSVPDKDRENAGVITVGGKTLTPEELSAALESKAADNVEVALTWKGQKIKTTFGELRNSGMRQADYTRAKQVIAAKEKELLEKEHQLEQQRAELERRMAEVPTAQLKAIAEALRTAGDGDKPTEHKPFASREAARTYLLEKLNGADATEGILELLDFAFSTKEHTEAELQKAVSEMKKEIEELKGTVKQERLLQYLQEERRQTATEVPEYAEESGFGRLVRMLTDQLAVSDKPDEEILGGLIGADTPRPAIARAVVDWLNRTSEERIQAVRTSQEAAQSARVTASQGEPPPVPDEILREIKEAGRPGDMERLGEAWKRLSAMRGLTG